MTRNILDRGFEKSSPKLKANPCNPDTLSGNSEKTYEQVTLCVGFTPSLYTRYPNNPLTQKNGAYACQSLRDSNNNGVAVMLVCHYKEKPFVDDTPTWRQ